VQLKDLQVSGGDVQFGSILFALLMNDYYDRHHIRAVSAAVLCNATNFTFEFYMVFKNVSTFYQCMIDPMIDYLVGGTDSLSGIILACCSVYPTRRDYQ
jgi:hypothetical protein